MKIKLIGWMVGFNKVRFNRLLRSEFGFSIFDAKNIVDRLLVNECVDIILDAKEETISNIKSLGVVIEKVD